MAEYRNSSKKKVGEFSEDKRSFTIVNRGVVTVITANDDGTLKAEEK